MLQAKRLLAVVVGSHDTQQHELSLKEGDKVSEQHCNDHDNFGEVGEVGDIGEVGEVGDGSHDTQQHELSLKEDDKVSVVLIVMTLVVTLVTLKGLVIQVMAWAHIPKQGGWQGFCCDDHNDFVDGGDDTGVAQSQGLYCNDHADLCWPTPGKNGDR